MGGLGGLGKGGPALAASCCCCCCWTLEKWAAAAACECAHVCKGMRMGEVVLACVSMNVCKKACTRVCVRACDLTWTYVHVQESEILREAGKLASCIKLTDPAAA